MQKPRTVPRTVSIVGEMVMLTWCTFSCTAVRAAAMAVKRSICARTRAPEFRNLAMAGTSLDDVRWARWTIVPYTGSERAVTMRPNQPAAQFREILDMVAELWHRTRVIPAYVPEDAGGDLGCHTAGVRRARFSGPR